MALSADDSVDGPETTSTRQVEKVTGSHLFKIMGYSLEKEKGKGNFLDSATFNVGGYDWWIKYYPNGVMSVQDDQASIFIYLKSKIEYVQAQTSFILLNQKEKALSTRTTTSILTFNSDTKNNIGYLKFAKQSALESVVEDDCLVIRCIVTVYKTFPAKPDLPLLVPPPLDIQQLSHLLEEGYGADVTFEVNGQTFNAHKCILAMRSQVFRAQFFGPLKEKSGTVIKIEDMEAPVFESLLNFIYSETVTEFEDINESEKKHNMAQHLLVAADRYDLERLKIICENILYGSVDSSNAVALFTLAERHNCIHLKAACLKLLASPEILGEVIATEQFQYLVQSNVSSTVDEVEPVKVRVVQRSSWLGRWLIWRWERAERRKERAQDGRADKQFIKPIRTNKGPVRYLKHLFKVAP